MPKRNFNPTHYLDILNFVSLEIEVVIESGQSYVYSAFYDGLNRCYDKVTKSVVRSDIRGHSYFVKKNQKYYLKDFLAKSLF